MSESSTPQRFERFADFYPFYLSQHANRSSRRLHFIGTSGVIACLAMLAWSGNPTWLLYSLLCGYGFAWVGHFFFEKNRPATFKYPFYSLLGDFVMYRDIWVGRLPR